jgi:hypothetical protein
VITALARALAAEVSGQAEALALAGALWSFPLREPRLLAADILAAWDGVEVAEWVADRAHGTADLRLLEALASTGLAAWRNGDRARAFHRAGAWLGGPNTHARELGLLLLLSIVEEGRSDDLRLVINLLAASPEVGVGTERKTLARLLISLARRTPRETARFLLDGVRRGNHAIAHVARQTLSALPPKQRQILEETLAQAEPSGIMPPSQ